MVGFHLQVALTSMKKNWRASAICIIAIALGVGVATTSTTIYLLVSQDPMPHKSDRLHYVRLHNWELTTEPFEVEPGDPPKAMTYRDMVGLLGSDIPEHRSGVARALEFVFPKQKTIKPFQKSLRLCHSDFFDMFDVPFIHGGPWTRSQDAANEPVVVLSKPINSRLFDGRNSVGEQVRIGARNFEVVGVLDHFRPRPLYYDAILGESYPPSDLFVPFDFIRREDWGIDGYRESWGPFPDGQAFYTDSEVGWIQFWVELEPDQVDAYGRFLDRYALGQKALGRFPRPLHNKVQPLMSWLSESYQASRSARLIMVMSLLFLATCALNITGLLLAKFLSQVSRISVHRALGASRRSVLIQHLLECELLGLAGGVFGVGLSIVGVGLVNDVSATRLAVGEYLGIAVLVAATLSLVAGLLAGFYPAWRACRITPSVQLRLR